MGQLAVTPLSDGRLQLWVAPITLLSSWQVSLDPAATWTQLSAFEPSPGQTLEVSAGHSPDGRAQLWAHGYDNVTRTTWKATISPDSGWIPWEPFQGNLMPVVGQLPDGRMQLWSADAENDTVTAWKTSTEPNAEWTAWTTFSPTSYGGILASGSLSDGLQQLWAKYLIKDQAGVFSTSGVLMSTWQQSNNPTTWNVWQNPFSPVLTGVAGGSTYTGACAAAQRSDGSLQVWAITSDQVLHSTWKTTSNASAPWTEWQSPFTPDPGKVVDLTVGRLADGSLQLWVTTLPAADGEYQILTSRQTSPGPNTTWTAWTSIGTSG